MQRHKLPLSDIDQQSENGPTIRSIIQHHPRQHPLRLPCGLQSVQPWYTDNEIGHSNASVTEVARFVEAQAQDRTTTTIRRRIASISTLLKLNNYPDVTRSPKIILALKRILRQMGHSQKQAPPLNLPEKFLGS